MALLFSDGLDDDVEKLERKSDELRKEGMISHDTCLYPMYVLLLVPSMLLRKVFHYASLWLFTFSLWSRSSLSFHRSMNILAFSLSWVLSVLGALGKVEMPVSSPMEEVSSAYRAWHGCAWWYDCFIFIHSFPSNLGTYVQVVLYIFHCHEHLRTFPLPSTHSSSYGS